MEHIDVYGVDALRESEELKGEHHRSRLNVWLCNRDGIARIMVQANSYGKMGQPVLRTASDEHARASVVQHDGAFCEQSSMVVTLYRLEPFSGSSLSPWNAVSK